MVMIDFCVMIHRDYPAAPPWNWSHGMPFGHRKTSDTLFGDSEIPMVFKGVFWLPGNARLKLVGDLSWPNPARTCFFPINMANKQPIHSAIHHPHRGWSRSVERYWDPWAATWDTVNTQHINLQKTHIWKNCTFSSSLKELHMFWVLLCVWIFGPLSLRYISYTPWAIDKVPPLPTRFLEFLGFGLHVFQHLRLRRGDWEICSFFEATGCQEVTVMWVKQMVFYHPQKSPKSWV